jgi:bacterioferritin-associated ferredoxin
VTEREVAGHVSVGADTVDKVGDSCLAGTGCGTCHDTIERIIDSAAGARPCVLASLRGEPISA